MTLKINIKNILKNVLILIIMISIFGSIIIFRYHDFNEKILKTNFKGLLIKKIIDNNDHNQPKLEINNNDTILTFNLQNDESGLFNYIMKGDTIEKFSNSLLVRIRNTKKDTIFILNF